jgi:hypothetical protein
VQEHRTGSPVTAKNAYSELQQLQKDPDRYLAQDYSTTLWGVPIPGADGQNFNGHLMEVDSNTYFRRVPEDLFNALVQSHDPANVMVNNGHVYVYEVPPGGKDKVKVEIVPPYRDQWNRDVSTGSFFPGGPGRGPGDLRRLNLALGPIEGDRLHANLELNNGYRYKTPTVTTIRGAAPSPDQTWELGIRQQDTSLLGDFRLSAGSIDFNAAQVEDLTDPGARFNGQELMIGNFRAYWDVGNRNREELNATLKPSAFVRARETGFSEIGLGADFVKWVYDKNGDYVSANGYYELQLYGPDFRDQLNLGSGLITSSRQALQPPPVFLIDPALQATATGNPTAWWGISQLDNLPYLSASPAPKPTNGTPSKPATPTTSTPPAGATYSLAT